MEYKIKRWDVVMFGNSITKFPMIYIKPDDLFIKHIEDNHNAIMVKICGTDMIYDGRLIPGLVKCQGNVCMITLVGQWSGYPDPDKLGMMGIVDIKESYNSNTNPDTDNDTDNKIIYKRFTYLQLLLVIVSLIILIFLFSRK
jgi:hypothetical protein